MVQCTVDSVLNPDPFGSAFIFGCPGSGFVLVNADSDPGAWKIDKSLQINMVFYLSKRLLYLRRYVFFTYYLLEVYFPCKNSFFV